MALKRNLLLIVLLALFIQKNGLAQQKTIIPDLSDVYVDKLVATATAYYPHVKSTQNHINALNDALSKNRAAFWEIITASYIYQPNQQTTINPVSPATSYFTGYQAGLFLNLGTLLERPWTVKQSKEELQIARYDREEYLITIASLVKKRYFVFLQRQAELQVQINAVQDNENSLNDIKDRFQKGTETFDVYNRALISFQQQKVTRIAAESALYSARVDVEELIGTKIENIK